MIELIAELSGNHQGSLTKALNLIGAAKIAGCTGVKFQCFEPERLAAKRVFHHRIVRALPEAPRSDIENELLELYRKTHTPREWFPQLIKAATEMDLTWHSSAFDPGDIDFLETLDCSRYKIASFEAGDSELLDRVRRTNKPVILSANQDENQHSERHWTVLHATNYGVEAKDAGLSRLRYWSHDRVMYPRDHWKWGLSDHTTDWYASEIAAALGASMIEWHIRLPMEENEPNLPDERFSWPPGVLATLVRRAKKIHRMLHDARQE